MPAGHGWSVVIIYAFRTDTASPLPAGHPNRRPLFMGDRSHIYDQIRDRGFSVRVTVLICYDTP
jgi:hypothetical protein